MYLTRHYLSVTSQKLTEEVIEAECSFTKEVWLAVNQSKIFHLKKCPEYFIDLFLGNIQGKVHFKLIPSLLENLPLPPKIEERENSPLQLI